MKIGIVGGHGHTSIKIHPGAELAWACDEYDQRAFERATGLHSGRSYRRMDDMLGDFRPDLVYIGSAYGLNGGLAIKALEAGYDVVCEKPLAADHATLARLRELTASGERRIIAELAMRWNPAFERARELIHLGTIGEVVMVQAQKSYRFGTDRPDFYKTRALFGGIIPWVGTHAIDFARWCTGLRYESVTGRHGNRSFPAYGEMEDHAALFFTMSGGVPCTITADFLRPEGAKTHSDDRLRVTGTKGVLEVRRANLMVTTASGKERWRYDFSEAAAIRCAQGLVDAAQGRPSIINTADSLETTAVALIARDAADQPGSVLPIP